MSRNLRYSEDELREQWAFIDSLVDTQAASLRSGVQDPEEDTVDVVTQSADLQREIDTLRERVRRLERERDELLQRVRAAERAAAVVAAPVRAPAQPVEAPRPQALPRPVQPAPPSVERRVREWWRRISR